MFEQNNHRKYSVDQNYENDENHTTSILFPQTDFFEPKETLDLLKLKYDPQLHLNSLINACFRSHQTKVVETYQKFNQLAHLQLEEPKISNFYMNDCFVNLYDVGKYFDGKIQKYATWVMGPIPSNFKKILDNIFIEEGCIPNFQRFLLFYPTYLQKHKVLERELFEQNRIDNKIAYFIGLLACAELGSVYGMNRMLTKFTNVGGNVEWVTKRKYPEKIRRILKLNRKLARSIWQVNSDLVEQILEANYWSKDQLALIIQILSFSYTFATIALAIGLNCQDVNNSIIDFKTLIDIKKDYDSINYESNQGQRLASVIQNLNRNSSNSEQENQKMQKKKEKLQKLQAEHSKSRKSLKKSIRRSDNEDIIQNYMRQIGNQLTKQQLYFKFQHVLKPMLPDYHVIDKRTDKEYPPVDAVDANFQHTAFPLLYSLTNKVAEMTLDIINYSELMTSNNFGKMSIQDTKKFRTAIRYYCENLCGCFHFQYNYKNIQNVVTMPLKFYARLLTLSPLHINKQVLRQIRHEEGQLNLFDLGHVAILAANCKMGLAITFAMKSFEY